MYPILITREGDYGIRIIRILSQNKKMTVAEISQLEDIPTKFAYKILKKLEKSHLVLSYRGVHGGYALVKPIEHITLYDILVSIDKDLTINDCTHCNYQCSRNSPDGPCKVHEELCRIQDVLYQELKAKPLSDILEYPCLDQPSIAIK